MKIILASKSDIRKKILEKNRNQKVVSCIPPYQNRLPHNPSTVSFYFKVIYYLPVDAQDFLVT